MPTLVQLPKKISGFEPSIIKRRINPVEKMSDNQNAYRLCKSSVSVLAIFTVSNVLSAI